MISQCSLHRRPSALIAFPRIGVLDDLSRTPPRAKLSKPGQHRRLVALATKPHG